MVGLLRVFRGELILRSGGVGPWPDFEINTQIIC